jgi:pimeloyl-ACP methyl ester carboxylesterase
MSTFVLVPGAWLGGWVWGAVALGLRERGHTVHPVTLPGLAERSSSTDVGLADHVADLREQLSGLDVHDVILLGHSYSGIVTGQVAAAEPLRVAHAVFLDANLPAPGKSMTDAWSQRGREVTRAEVEANDGLWPVPDPEDFDGHDLTAEQLNWLLAHATPHPGRTLFEPAALERPLDQLRGTYVQCLHPARPRPPEADVFGWGFKTIDTGHWPMVSRPKELVDLLDEIA